MSAHPLVGKAITRIDVATDLKAIRFVCEDGEVVACAEGDCCSETWVEGLDTPGLVLGSPVLAVEDVPMPDLGTPKECEHVEYYGCKITTAKGVCVIDYRNESNGYYGGNLSWPGDWFYGGCYGQNVSTNEWKQVAP